MEVKLRSKKFGYRLHSVLSVFITVHCSGFTTYAVINPPGYELANRTSLQCREFQIFFNLEAILAHQT